MTSRERELSAPLPEQSIAQNIAHFSPPSEGPKEYAVSVRVQREESPEVRVGCFIENLACPRCASSITPEAFPAFLREQFPGQSVQEIGARLNRTPGYIYELLEGIRPPNASMLRRFGFEVCYRRSLEQPNGVPAT